MHFRYHICDRVRPGHLEADAGEQLDAFLDTYLALESDDTLRERRDLWMISTVFFDQMYHRTQILSDVTGKQTYTVQQIEAYLTHRFV